MAGQSEQSAEPQIVSDSHYLTPWQALTWKQELVKATSRYITLRIACHISSLYVLALICIQSLVNNKRSALIKASFFILKQIWLLQSESCWMSKKLTLDITTFYSMKSHVNFPL